MLPAQATISERDRLRPLLRSNLKTDRLCTLEIAMDRRTVMMGLAIAGSGALCAEATAQTDAAHPLVAAFAKTLSAHDMGAFGALFADDYVNHQVSAAAPKPPPGVTAKQGTVAFFAARLKGLPDLSVAIEASVANGDMAAASFVYTGTHRGDYLGVAPTGKSLRFTSCDIFRIRDGKIVEHWGMGDIAGMLAQMKG
jgi:steroid delta-isomerase-like uncharacterized protein